MCKCADGYVQTGVEPYYGCIPDTTKYPTLPLFLFNNQKTVKGFTLTIEELSAPLSKPKATAIYSQGHSNTVGLDYYLADNTFYWSAVSSYGLNSFIFFDFSFKKL